MRQDPKTKSSGKNRRGGAPASQDARRPSDKSGGKRLRNARPGVQRPRTDRKPSWSEVETNRQEVLAPSAIPDEERLEGRNAVAEALAAGRAFNKVWYLKPLPDKRPDRRLAELIHQFHSTEAVLYPVDRKALDRMAVTPSHQGIIAQVAAHEYVEPEDILALAEARGEQPFILLLDQIQDSQNLGAIMRTADAVGVHGIIIPRRRSVALDAAAAKASAGAIEHVKVARVTNLNRTIETLKAQGIWVCGLAMEGEPLFNSDKLNVPLALVIGSEGDGISDSVQKNCDFLLQIPMRGKINSLNASNAAAIAVYEVLRQRQLAADA